MEVMTTKEAVMHVLSFELVQSKYALAKHVLGVQPIMIDNYMKNTKMSTATAEKFLDQFDIAISDAYDGRSKL